MSSLKAVVGVARDYFSKLSRTLCAKFRFRARGGKNLKKSIKKTKKFKFKFLPLQTLPNLSNDIMSKSFDTTNLSIKIKTSTGSTEICFSVLIVPAAKFD
jgi:hypothetical protein